MSTPESSGVDLARVALTAAKQAARDRGADRGQAARKPKRRPRTLPRDGRDPMGLGTALARLVVERGWEAPAAGGSVLDRWDEITAVDFAGPDFPRHVRAVGFDADTGVLELLPDSSAWGTQARLIAAQLMDRANEHARSRNAAQLVRRIRVLSPGPAAHRTPAAPALPAAPATVDRPDRTEPPDGYRQAKAHLAARRSSRTSDPAIAAAARSQASSPRFREPTAVFAAVIARYDDTPRPARRDTPR